MTHIVTESCILCKHTKCADVCPVDCFRETPFMLVIDPDECIDCAVCIPECPINAIYAEEDAPSDQQQMLEVNRTLSSISKSISKSKTPLPYADTMKNVPFKFSLISNYEHYDPYCAHVNENHKEKIQYQELLKSFDDTHQIVRILAPLHEDFVFNKDRVMAGINDINESVRALYVLKGAKYLNSFDIESLINDRSIHVRLSVVNNLELKLTQPHIEKLLCDSERSVRVAMITRSDFQPTEEQFFRVVESNDEAEIVSMISKIRFELIPKAILHSLPFVRLAAYELESWSPTTDQLMIGLNDESWQVQFSIINRKDFSLTPALFLKYISDERFIDLVCKKGSNYCITHALSMAEENEIIRVIELTPKMSDLHYSQCFLDQRTAIALKALNTIDYLKPEHIDQCLLHSSEKVRFKVASTKNVDLSFSQFTLGLNDRSHRVRKAIALRKNFSPTVDQFNKGIKDKSEGIRNIYLTQFKLEDDKIVRISKPNMTLDEVLIKINDIPTWTKEKYKLKEKLYHLLSELNFIRIEIHTERAIFTRFGENAVINNTHKRPYNKISSDRIHLVCLGNSPNSQVQFAAKAVLS